MQPPLIGPNTQDRFLQLMGTTQAHVFGHLQNFRRSETHAIKTWLTKVERQVRQFHRPITRESLPELIKLQYVVSPPFDWVKDSVTGDFMYRRFSCAGFVLACYDEGAGIVLLDWQADDFPEVDLDTLNMAYGNIEELGSEDRTRIGIPEEGPWPRAIVLAGYIVHSLNRPDEVIRSEPYIPDSCDKGLFP